MKYIIQRFQYCNELHCTVLYYIMLHCTVLCNTAVHCNVRTWIKVGPVARVRFSTATCTDNSVAASIVDSMTAAVASQEIETFFRAKEASAILKVILLPNTVDAALQPVIDITCNSSGLQEKKLTEKRVNMDLVQSQTAETDKIGRVRLHRATNRHRRQSHDQHKRLRWNANTNTNTSSSVKKRRVSMPHDKSYLGDIKYSWM